MAQEHSSKQYDLDLETLRSRVLEMGGLVESQIVGAMHALNEFDRDTAEKVIAAEETLNAMEVDIDQECGNIIARRQPAARDLRLLMSISKTITNLERAGDDFRRRALNYQEPHLTRNLKIAEKVKEIAARHGRSAGEAAIAWTLRRPEVTAAIVGVRSPAQVAGLIGAAEFRLSEAEIAEIAAFISAL